MYAWHIFLSLEKKNNYSIFIFLIYEKQSFSWFFLQYGENGPAVP